MNLFRLEEHIDRWLGGRSPGATLPVATLSALAHSWWGDRLAPQWKPHSRHQNQAILDSVGLVEDFWQLA